MDKEALIEQYRPFVGMFVVAERKNDRKAIGILKSITVDNKLFIQGTEFFWMVDPEEITDFSARPDRYKNGSEGDTHR